MCFLLQCYESSFLCYNSKHTWTTSYYNFHFHWISQLKKTTETASNDKVGLTDGLTTNIIFLNLPKSDIVVSSCDKLIGGKRIYREGINYLLKFATGNDFSWMEIWHLNRIYFILLIVYSIGKDSVFNCRQSNYSPFVHCIYRSNCF